MASRSKLNIYTRWKPAADFTPASIREDQLPTGFEDDRENLLKDLAVFQFVPWSKTAGLSVAAFPSQLDGWMETLLGGRCCCVCYRCCSCPTLGCFCPCCCCCCRCCCCCPYPGCLLLPMRLPLLPMSLLLLLLMSLLPLLPTAAC